MRTSQRSKTLLKKFSLNRLEQFIVALTIISLLLLFLLNKILVLNISGLRILLIYGFAVLCVHLLVFSSAIFKYKDLAELGAQLESHTISELPLVSCMVAVHNEEDFVTTCLESMFAQSYPNKEIIVVDDASTDDTLKVLKQYRQTHPDLKIISIKKNVGKKGALCGAMFLAKGSLYAHTDSDSVWEPNAINQVVRIFMNNPDVGAVSGHGRANNAAVNTLTRMQDSWMEGQFSIRKAFESSYGTVTCVSGPLAVYRKQAVYNFLPMWRHDRFLGSEFKFATDRTLTAIVLGAPWVHKKTHSKYAGSIFLKERHPIKAWKVVYSKSARSRTIVPDTLGKLLKQQIRWKKSFIRNVFFNAPFFWRKPIPVVIVYYAHIIFVVCAPIIATRIFLISHPHRLQVIGSYLLSVIAIGLLFGLSLRFEDKECKYWYYRPLMSLLSATMLGWVIIYSALTVRNMKWHRG